MIKTKTVFILGAGASCPYGYPSGETLREEICSNFVHDYKSWRNSGGREAVTGRELSAVEEFAEKFERSHTGSIDLFLSRNPEFIQLGKLAILFRILDAEQKSSFGHHIKDKSRDWYLWLFKQLTDELVKKGDYSRFHENNISFITFNYDRSLEYFLYDSLVHSFNPVEPITIIEPLNQIRIIHVFHQIAPLRWQDARRGLDYRTVLKHINVEILKKNLRIVYEEGENPELEEARKIISAANRIFFLGFGYANENLDVLGIPGILNKDQLVYGTALVLTPREIENVHSILRVAPSIRKKGGAVNVHIKNLDCRALLREYL